jgi:16S rRNA U1498 N3-methylase RsmE
MATATMPAVSARERGAIFAALGARRLRAETAGIVAVAIAAARCGDI